MQGSAGVRVCLRPWYAELTADGRSAAQAFKGLKSLIVNALFNATNSKGQNPLWEGILYEGPDLQRPVSPMEARKKAEAVLQKAILDLTNPPCK